MRSDNAIILLDLFKKHFALLLVIFSGFSVVSEIASFPTLLEISRYLTITAKLTKRPSAVADLILAAHPSSADYA